MRYFAILKDSLRESLDSKVLYVMLALSTIVIVLVGSLSFRPLPAEKTMDRFFWKEVPDPFNEDEPHQRPPVFATMLLAKNKEKPNPIDTVLRRAAEYPYRLVKVDASGAEDAPDGEFTLTIARIVPPKVKDDKKGGFRLDFGPEDPAKGPEIVRGIFREAEADGYLKVETIERLPAEDAAKETVRYRVTVKGTPKTVRIWMTEPAWIFGAVPLSWMTGPLAMQMIGLSYFVTAIGSWVTVLVGIIITSFFFPNMLRKGTVDLLLVKPVHRWALLLYKYIGGLTFIFVCTAYTIVGMWLVLGLRSGLWPNGSLLLIFTITFFFSILYAISTFVGVVTRSTVTAIMLTLMAYALLGGSGIAHAILESNVKKEEAREAMQKDKGRLKVLMPQEQPGPEEANAAEGSRWADSYLVAGSRAVQAVSPRTEDLNTLNTLIISADFMTGNIGDMGRFDSGERNWWVSFLVCILWISIFLGLASLWFTFKDY